MTASTTKILIVFNSLEVGGIETKIIDLCQYFSSQPQYQLLLLLKHYQGPLLPLVPCNVPIITPHLTDLIKLRTLFFPLWLSWQFRRLKPDIILSFGNYSSICSVIGRLVCHSKSKLIISEDSSITTQLETESFPLTRKLLLKLTYPLATRLIVLSQAGKQKLLKFVSNKDKISIVPNWISPRLTDSLPHSVLQKDIDVLFLGRFEDQKNPLRFVQIMKLLSQKQSSLKCVMVGNGSLKPKTEELIRKLKLDHIIETLPATIYPASFLLRSKILLLTSNHEGFPLTLLEATAAHCLPVMTSLPETDDYYNNHRQHLIYKQDQEAVEKLNYLLSRKKLCRRISTIYANLALENQQSHLLQLTNLLTK